MGVAYVVHGAECACSMSQNNQTATISASNANRAVNGNGICNMMDIQIGGFGNCTTLTAMASGVTTPCPPKVPITPWLNCATGFMKDDLPVVTEDSMAICPVGGGVITFNNSGQGNTRAQSGARSKPAQLGSDILFNVVKSEAPIASSGVRQRSGGNEFNPTQVQGALATMNDVRPVVSSVGIANVIRDEQNSDNEKPAFNSPYWVARDRVVHDRIEVVGSSGAALHATPGGEHRTTLRPGTILNVERARIVNGDIWFGIGNSGWVRNSDSVKELGSTEERGTRMIVLPQNEDAVVSIFGYWDPARPAGQHNRRTILRDRHFEQIIERHGFDALAGTRLVGEAARGLIEGSVVFLTGGEVSDLGQGWVQILQWGNTGHVLVLSYAQMIRRELAQEIIDRYHRRSSSGKHISLREWATNMTFRNRRSVYANLVDTADGLEATRSDYSNNYPYGSSVSIGGTVMLNENLLRAILHINDRFGTFAINSLTGGRHHAHSNHYRGRAVDLQGNADRTIRYTNDPANTNNNVHFIPVMQYLQNVHGFTTQSITGYTGHRAAFHLDILD